MEIDYKAFVAVLNDEARRACEDCLAKTNQPGYEDRQGYFEALASAPTLLRCFYCKDTSYFEYEPVLKCLEREIRECIGLVLDYRYAFYQHLEFARARGYLFVLRLLQEHAARMIHVEPVPELQTPKEVKVIWHLS